MTKKRKSPWRWLLWPAAVAAVIYMVLQLLQTVGIHRHSQFIPDYEMEDLTAILSRETLSHEDYTTILIQTGLSKTAVDSILEGDRRAGIAQILETQEGFFYTPKATCKPLLPARFTCEDLLLTEEGQRFSSVPLAPLLPGDILLTFSTHSVGWRHGHGGLVVETDPAVTLEATVLGSNSEKVRARHWPTYGNFLVLRVADADDATRRQVVDNALAAMDDIPYSLFAGVWGEKAPAMEEHHTAQCAYLPWYAWQTVGVDLDSDGGRIVTIRDLAESPRLKIVQVCGIDPRAVLQAGRVDEK